MTIFFFFLMISEEKSFSRNHICQLSHKTAWFRHVTRHDIWLKPIMQVTAYINNTAQSGFITSTLEQDWLFHSPDVLWLPAPTVTHQFLHYPFASRTPFRSNDSTEKRSREKDKIMYNINIQLTGFKLKV